MTIPEENTGKKLKANLPNSGFIELLFDNHCGMAKENLVANKQLGFSFYNNPAK